MRPDDPLFAQLLQTWDDAWRIAHPGAAHPPSFHVTKVKATLRPTVAIRVRHPGLAPRIVSVRIDTETTASDHQPVIVEFS